MYFNVVPEAGSYVFRVRVATGAGAGAGEGASGLVFELAGSEDDLDLGFRGRLYLVVILVYSGEVVSKV